MHLAAVATSEGSPSTNLCRVLISAPGLPPRIIEPEFCDVPVPIFSTRLLEYARVTGELIDAGEYGTQAAGTLALVYRGGRQIVTAALMPLIGRPALLLPLRLFESGHLL